MVTYAGHVAEPNMCRAFIFILSPKPNLEAYRVRLDKRQLYGMAHEQRDGFEDGGRPKQEPKPQYLLCIKCPQPFLEQMIATKLPRRPCFLFVFTLFERCYLQFQAKRPGCRNATVASPKGRLMQGA